jgi:hypothetical protein
VFVWPHIGAVVSSTKTQRRSLRILPPIDGIQIQGGMLSAFRLLPKTSGFEVGKSGRKYRTEA